MQANLVQISTVSTEQKEKSFSGHSSTGTQATTPKTPPSSNVKTRPNGLDTFDIAGAILKYRITTSIELMEPPILLKIDQSPIATLGNFSLLIGRAKSRKTFLATALTAAAAIGKCSIESITGIVRSENTILYFDTEQSPYHAQRTIKRICKQIGDNDPKNFKAFGLRPLEPSERLRVIQYAIENTAGLALVVIDGIADLLSNGINDEAEAIKLTSAILRWTQEKNIHIITVLHQNKADFNARGHIGTALVNKAEAVLSITKDLKDQNISIVKAEYCRDTDFMPFAFIIDKDGLPLLTDQMEGLQSRKVDNMTEIMKACFPGMINKGFNELCKEYSERGGTSTVTAKRHIKKCLELKIIKRDNVGNYSFSTDINAEPLPF